MEHTKLSKHFTLEEFVNTQKYPCNKLTNSPTNYSRAMAGSTSPGVPSPTLATTSGLGITNEKVHNGVGSAVHLSANYPC